MQVHKLFLASIVIAASTGVGVTSAHAVTSDYPDYTVEDGVDLYVDSCATGGDFTVTIDGDVYEPGDIASGFSLESSVSFTPSDGVTVGWLPGGVVQDGYGHGFARDIDNGEFLSAYDPAPTSWGDLAVVDLEGAFHFFPGVFYSPCDTPAGKYAHVQVFPGWTFEEIGIAMDVEGFPELLDEAAYTASGLGEPSDGGLTFAPLSNFANGGYAFWAAYFENSILGNPLIGVSFEGPIPAVDYRQAAWGYLGYDYPGGLSYDDFASGFYLLEPGSDSLSESSLDSVYEAPVPSSAPTETIENRGIFGIFLYIAGQPAREVKSTPVYFGSVGIKADSSYILSVQSVTNPALTRTVLATGSTNSRGHADRRIELGNLAPGTYKVVMTGVHDGGYSLVLTNYISVDRDGNFISLSPESLQPTLN
jgi:hypothetical protein